MKHQLLNDEDFIVELQEMNWEHSSAVKIQEMPPAPSSNGSPSRTVDTTDHNGLRGIASLWIMFFHIFVYTNSRIDIQGSTLMPLFFALSGFSMAIGYTGKLWNKKAALNNAAPGNDSAVVLPENIPLDRNSSGNEPMSSSTRFLVKFYYNRLIRIMPVYYLCLILALPMTYAGYGTMQLSYHFLSSTPSSSATTLSTLLVNILPIATWTAFFLGVPINGPEWTITTLVFFWLFFPYLLRYYEKLSDNDLLVSIIRLYWWNVGLGVICFVLGLFIGGFGCAFWLSTGWPISRLPVFIVGMNAGILCHRYAHLAVLNASRGKGSQEDEEATGNHIDEGEKLTVPWFPATWTIVPFRYSCICYCSNSSRGVSFVSNKVDFAKTITWRSIQLLVFTVALACLQAGDIYIAGNIWFQFLNVFAQVDILVAFCQYGTFLLASSSNGCSSEHPWTFMAAQYAVRFLRHPWSQWFGELSMSLYLVHWPVIFYACWFLRGSLLHWPSTFDCSNKYADDAQLRSQCQDTVNAFKLARTPQYWMVPVIAAVAIGFATVLHYCVEVPVRTRFK